MNYNSLWHQNSNSRIATESEIKWENHATRFYSELRIASDILIQISIKQWTHKLNGTGIQLQHNPTVNPAVSTVNQRILCGQRWVKETQAEKCLARIIKV
jgi:hypothetical protein